MAEHHLADNPSNIEVAHYTCYRTRARVGANGLLNDSAWEGVPRSPRFVDVVSGAPALYDSFAAATRRHLAHLVWSL